MILLNALFGKILLAAILPIGFWGALIPILSGAASLLGGGGKEKSSGGGGKEKSSGGGGILGDLLPGLIEAGGGLLGGILGGKNQEDMSKMDLENQLKLLQKQHDLGMEKDKGMLDYKKERAQEFRPTTERYETYKNIAPMDEMMKKMAMGMMKRDTLGTGGALNKYGINMSDMMERMFSQPKPKAEVEPIQDNSDIVSGGRPGGGGGHREERHRFTGRTRRNNYEDGSGRPRI